MIIIKNILTRSFFSKSITIPLTKNNHHFNFLIVFPNSKYILIDYMKTLFYTTKNISKNHIINFVINLEFINTYNNITFYNLLFLEDQTLFLDSNYMFVTSIRDILTLF